MFDDRSQERIISAYISHSMKGPLISILSLLWCLCLLLFLLYEPESLWAEPFKEIDLVNENPLLLCDTLYDKDYYDYQYKRLILKSKFIRCHIKSDAELLNSKIILNANLRYETLCSSLFEGHSVYDYLAKKALLKTHKYKCSFVHYSSVDPEQMCKILADETIAYSKNVLLKYMLKLKNIDCFLTVNLTKWTPIIDEITVNQNVDDVKLCDGLYGETYKGFLIRSEVLRQRGVKCSEVNSNQLKSFEGFLRESPLKEICLALSKETATHYLLMHKVLKSRNHSCASTVDHSLNSEKLCSSLYEGLYSEYLEILNVLKNRGFKCETSRPSLLEEWKEIKDLQAYRSFSDETLCSARYSHRYRDYYLIDRILSSRNHTCDSYSSSFWNLLYIALVLILLFIIGGMILLFKSQNNTEEFPFYDNDI